MDRITGLETFIKVADAQSFSAAAWQMNVSPAKLTKAVQALEKEIGFKLFNRTTRRMELTTQGQSFYPLAQEIVERFEQSKLISNQSFEPSGVIRIAVPNVIANFFLFEPLQSFLEKYPKISVELILDNASLLINTNEVDIAFSPYKVQNSKLHFHELYSAPRQLIASPTYLERHGHPQSILDLQHHACLVNSLAHPDGIWQFGKQQIKGHARIKSPDSSQLIDAALANLGILWIPQFFVECFIQKGKLQVIPICHDPHISKVYLCYPALSKRNKSRLLAEFLIQHFLDHQTQAL